MSRLKAFIAHISSMGDSAESWLWFITQMVNVDDLGISGGFRSIFRAIAVVAPKNINAVNAFLATTFVPMPSGGMEEIMSLMKQSPVNRAFYDGKSNQWYLMPELENHSGYNRDSRTYLKEKPSPSQVVSEVKPSDARSQLERLYQASTDRQLVKSENEDIEQALIDYVKRKAPICLREIVRSGCLRKADVTSTDDYKIFLELLVSEGKLSGDSEGYC